MVREPILPLTGPNHATIVFASGSSYIPSAKEERDGHALALQLNAFCQMRTKEGLEEALRVAISLGRKGWGADATNMLKLTAKAAALEGTSIPFSNPSLEPRRGTGKTNRYPAGTPSVLSKLDLRGGDAEHSGCKKLTTQWIQDAGKIAHARIKELHQMCFDPDALGEADTRRDLQSRLDVANWMVSEIEPDLEIIDDDMNHRKAMVDGNDLGGGSKQAQGEGARIRGHDSAHG